ncbi:MULTISPECIES: hypothetical protein [Micrococcaceae]|uniref:hypothetical protein n=1 Tax=Micrococcaceae TaxID=1268 RepID=UPI00047A8435|nr:MULTISPECIES: hypothetical protein [Micrococcaceae]BCW59867.1 hypothetical protein StoSoilB20_32140 [Arthrobacter sp. StoSoilB20]
MNFDTGVADRLIGACRDAARTLQDQLGGRESLSTAALTEFRGVFADCFRENVAAERAARSELVHMLEDVARQVQDAKSAAEVEQRRLDDVTEWVLASGWVRAGGGVGVNVGPRPSMEETDRPVVSVNTVRQGLRVWASGSTAGASSADPDTLESAVSTFRIQDGSDRGAADRVSAAGSEFEDKCSWVHSDLDAVRGGLRRFLEDNHQDATRLSDIASTFRAAGGSGDVGQVTVSNGLLVLATVPMSLSGVALLSYLSTASEADVKALATIPGWQQTLRGMDPSKIGAWWAGMKTGAHTAVNESGFTQVQELLLAAAPAMFGALDGMPALARVRANQLNAPSLLRAAEKDLETARKLSGIGQAHHDPNRTKMLENEVAYLKQAEAGQVQLYLYDRDQSRIVEMIGTPGPDTRHVITYVPGTFTGMNIFYTGGVQQVSRYLNNNVPGTVAFVYKDGRFPGEADTAGGPNLARIGEANDEKLARTSGQQLAGFETGMRTDPYLNGAEQTGIGHSWGLANLTSSEVAGARYDKVISLAGAGMLPDWKPQPTTEYSNLYYYDLLVHGQGVPNLITKRGVVWDGNNPIHRDEFEQHYYRGPHDDQLRAINTVEEGNILMENHNLIASDSKDNKKALKDMLGIVTR